jgi:hypothetical protein
MKSSFAQDANGQKWVVGYSEGQQKLRPMKMLTIEGGTGTSFTDDNGSTVILQSIDTQLSRVFTGTVPV